MGDETGSETVGRDHQTAVPESMGGSDWNRDFLELAKWWANRRSKDPRTKVGAVIVNDRNIPVGLGYNGFPRGVDDSPEIYLDRPSKLQKVVHAEANAIINSNSSVVGCRMFVSLPPCHECAKLIIQAGITEVHHYLSDRIDPVSMEMFEQAGVQVIIHGPKEPSSLIESFSSM